EVMGIDQKVEMNSVIETETLVKSSDEETTLLSVSYTRLMIETISPNAAFSFDTKDPADQPGIDYLRSLIGKPFQVSINHRGEITEISGLKKVMEQIISEVDTTSGVFENFKNTIKVFFEKEQIKNTLAQMIPVYTEKSISKGDSWHYSINSRTGQFEFLSSNTAKVIEIKQDIVILQIDSKVSIPEDRSMNLQGLNAFVNLSGTEMAELRIDPETGITTHGIKKQNIKAILLLDMSDRDQENIEIPMKISTSTEASVIFL
ncbi:MAG: DUF6263 family protein, partial [Bacteroidota bacterium]